MAEEIYETDIGLFKISEHDNDISLVNVYTYLPGMAGGVWDHMGYMKRKEFFKLIDPYNPKKKNLDKIGESSF